MYFRRFPRTQHTLCEDVQDAVYVLNRKKTINHPTSHPDEKELPSSYTVKCCGNAHNARNSLLRQPLLLSAGSFALRLLIRTRVVLPSERRQDLNVLDRTLNSTGKINVEEWPVQTCNDRNVIRGSRAVSRALVDSVFEVFAACG